MLVIIGLIVDLLGVLIMAIPIMTTDVNVLGTWGQFEMGKKDAIKAKKYTLAGLALIAFGFILQIIGQII